MQQREEKRELPILVIGAGIAGLTAAAALGQKGFAVDLIEKRSEIWDGGGVGLSIVANAMRALNEIGVAEACVRAGMPADSIAMCRADGALLFDNPVPRIGGARWPGATGIARADFHQILLEAASRSADIRCGVTVEDWTEESDLVRVRFSDGAESAYRLVVSAEGIYSSTRAKLFPDSKPAMTGQAVWRAEVPRPENVRRTHLFLGGRQGLVGICPISETRAYLYIVQGSAPGERRDTATLDTQILRELDGYGGAVADVANHITDPASVSYRPIEAILAPRPWGVGRVVMIGDAVHANPPVIAQGAAMGIEDAIVLADELAKFDHNLLEALTGFIDRRFDRAAYVVETSCQLAKWEVEHAKDVDIPGVMKASAMRLAEAI